MLPLGENMELPHLEDVHLGFFLKLFSIIKRIKHYWKLLDKNTWNHITVCKQMIDIHQVGIVTWKHNYV